MGIWGILGIVVIGGGLLAWFVAKLRSGAVAEVLQKQEKKDVETLLEMHRPATDVELKLVRNEFRRD